MYNSLLLNRITENTRYGRLAFQYKGPNVQVYKFNEGMWIEQELDDEFKREIIINLILNEEGLMQRPSPDDMFSYLKFCGSENKLIREKKIEMVFDLILNPFITFKLLIDQLGFEYDNISDDSVKEEYLMHNDPEKYADLIIEQGLDNSFYEFLILGYSLGNQYCVPRHINRINRNTSIRLKFPHLKKLINNTQFDPSLQVNGDDKHLEGFKKIALKNDAFTPTELNDPFDIIFKAQAIDIDAIATLDEISNKVSNSNSRLESIEKYKKSEININEKCDFDSIKKIVLSQKNYFENRHKKITKYSYTEDLIIKIIKNRHTLELSELQLYIILTILASPNHEISRRCCKLNIATNPTSTDSVYDVERRIQALEKRSILCQNQKKVLEVNYQEIDRLIEKEMQRVRRFKFYEQDRAIFSCWIDNDKVTDYKKYDIEGHSVISDIYIEEYTLERIERFINLRLSLRAYLPEDKTLIQKMKRHNCSVFTDTIYCDEVKD